MPNIRDLQAILERLTGMHPNAIDRSVRKLTEAGHLPPAGDGLRSEDAATLIIALAASRAPIEAVEAIEDYRHAPLTTATTATGGAEVALVIDADKQPVLDIGEWTAVRISVVNAVALLLSKIPALRRAGRPHVVCLEIAMRPGAPIAVLTFLHAPPRALRLIYSDPNNAESAPWTTSRFVDERIFNGIAALFDESAIAAAQAAAAIGDA